ncbi:O-antigen ligase family protein [Flavobacteriales bacterium]|nr:O-antigen ligase family protein [Flavobacteriales bacterium]
MKLIGILFIVFYFIIFGYAIDKISRGKIEYIIIYICTCLPIYTTLQAQAFKIFNSEIVVTIIKLSKDIIFVYVFMIFLFGKNINLFNRSFKFSLVDKLILFFSFLVTIYALIPLGEADIFSKLIYAKNLYIISITYLIGRNIEINKVFYNKIKKILKYLILSITIFLCFEFILSTHFHTIIDFSNYNNIINEIDPQGNYDLSWSFESQDSSPRYAAFFADPLELSASLLLLTSLLIFNFWNNKRNINYFLLFMVAVAFLFSFSRGSIVACIGIVFFGLMLNKNYKILLLIVGLFLLSTLSLVYFGSEEIRYLIIDTLKFENTSSLGHLVEWIEGILSILENPLGIGLAMSGNASGVDQAIKVGGENQFLIFGVQMGVLSLILYVLILFFLIRRSSYVYLKTLDYNKHVSFIVACTKFGLLLPLLTANAELYLFVSLATWFFAGYVESKYIELKFEKNKSLY